MNLANEITQMAQVAKQSAYALATTPTALKNKVLHNMAKPILSHKDFLMVENQKDLAEAHRQNYPKALVDRLTMTERVIKEMAVCLQETAQLKDPVGEVMRTIKRPNGLMIKKIRTPIGVIGIIFESRPNVVSDCIGLCLKSGNAAILKGGREACFSNKAIFKVLQDVLKGSRIPHDSIHLIESTDREAVTILLGLDKYVDLIIPRGGEELIEFVASHSRIPVIKHYKGICHIYVSHHADLGKALKICFNAKVQKPAVCNAMETLLVEEKVAKKFLPRMIGDFQKANVEIRGCPVTRQIVKDGVKEATEEDWEEEYLDLILSVKVVKNLKDAVQHINRYGSHHSDAIITENKKEAEEFLKSVDSACLYVNASTRFTDGYQFGFGAEIGISTDKLHARGPMALEELTTYKYIVYGKGQIRT